MQYRILMMTLAVAMTLPGMAAQAAEVASTWSAKALSMSSGRAGMDRPNHPFQRIGSFGAATVPALTMVSAANLGSGIGGAGDDYDNALMFAAPSPTSPNSPSSPSAAAGPASAGAGRIAQNSPVATAARPTSNAGQSTDSEAFMTLLACVGVIGFLAFKRGGAQSSY